jgi:hypothetical protein
MREDPRCCGTGTCIIDPEGVCWCGQKWDGEKMARPQLVSDTPPNTPTPESVVPQPEPQTQPESKQKRL